MSAKTRNIMLIVGAFLVFAVFGWFVVLPRLQPAVFNGQVIQSGAPAPAVTLEGPGGEPVSLTDFEDKVVVMYFGYTWCPDVCPVTLSKLANVKEMLGEDGDEVQVVMITVDPERDTSAVLEEYMAHFDPTFIGLTGDPADINRIATIYGVYYEPEDSTSAVGYLVNHTSTLMVVDKSGELKLILPFDLTEEQVAADLARFLG